MAAIIPPLLRVFAVGICSIIGAAVIVFVYLQGVNLGREVGKGEFACCSANGKFIALEEDGYAQCESTGPIKWVYSVEIEPPCKNR